MKKDRTESLCDRDCNRCPIVGHPNNRLLTALLNQLHSRFGNEVYRIVETACPNLTVCFDCRVDDFVHVKGCKIIKHNRKLQPAWERVNKWKRLAEDALLVLEAYAVGHATQVVIRSALEEDSSANRKGGAA